MSDQEKAIENEVFDQELSMADLDAAAGGVATDDEVFSSKNCRSNHERDIYGKDGFPNCARTVEDGSHCGSTDACYQDAVLYLGMGISCSKAWR